MTWVHTERLSQFHELDGQGPPVVFVSGMATNRLPWQLFYVPALVEAGYRVLTFDNRDTGKSEPSPTERYAIADLADDTATLLAELGLAGVHLVGHSMGGMVAQELALRHPERIATLTLLGSSPGCGAHERALLRSIRAAKASLSDSDFWTLMATRTLSWRAFEDDAAVSRFMAFTSTPECFQSIDALSRQIDAMLSYDAGESLGAISVPTHVVCGAEDQMLPPRHSHRLHEIVPGSMLSIIDGAGHSLVTEGAVPTLRAMLGFWSGLTAPGPPHRWAGHARDAGNPRSA